MLRNNPCLSGQSPRVWVVSNGERFFRVKDTQPGGTQTAVFCMLGTNKILNASALYLLRTQVTKVSRLKLLKATHHPIDLILPQLELDQTTIVEFLLEHL